MQKKINQEDYEKKHPSSRINKYGKEIIYTGATIPVDIYNEIERQACEAGLSKSHLIAQALTEKFGKGGKHG